MKFAFTALYEQLKTLLKNSKATLKNVVVILLVFGLEQIFEKGVFKCPISNYHVYGFLFIVGPAVCLFNLTLLLHNHFWDVVTGCRHQHFSRRWVCKNVVRVAFQAILPSGVWIVTALVQSHYFVCAKLGPKQEALKNAINDTAKEQIENDYATAEAQSQILAWILFDSLVVVGTLAVCVRRCCFLRAEGSLPTIHDFEKIEAEVAVAKFKERVEEEAKKEGELYVKTMFDQFQDNVDGYSKVAWVHNQLTKTYPRSTGNLNMPYRHREGTTEADGKPEKPENDEVAGKPEQNGTTTRVAKFSMEVMTS